MKIAMVPGVYNKRGGIGRYVAEVSERLTMEHEVHVYATEWRDVTNTDIIFHKVPGILSSQFLEQLTFTPLCAIQLKIGSMDYDIINGHSALSLVQDVITMHSCHRAWADIQKNEDRFFKIRPTDMLVSTIEKHNLKKSNYKKIISVSEGVKRELQHYYNVPSEDIEVIPTGVDLEEFKPDKIARAQIRKQYNIDENDVVLFFSGYEFHRKGLRFIIESLRMLPENVKLLVVGKDDPLPYIKLANDLGVKERVIFAGFVETIKSCFSASDVFVFPTAYEAFSLVTLEAAASGLPVLATKINGTEELIKEGYNGLFIKRDPVDISEKISQIMDNENLRRNMGRNARKTAEKYSWKDISKRTLEVYAEVLGM